MTIRSFLKGLFGEALNRLEDGFTLPHSEYHSFHNIVIPGHCGTTEIDHVIVSRFGVFVVESKNWSGWLFGSEHDKTWTRISKRSKLQVRNPLRQNHGHLLALAKLLGLPANRIHSLVAIRGAEFKTPIPKGVVMGGYAKQVRQYNEEQFNAAELERILAALHSPSVANSWLARFRHKQLTKAKWST
jgi:hypothetical protein